MRLRIEAQYANEAKTDQNQAQHATTWGECEDTWQCHGTTRKNIPCQRLTQARTCVAQGAAPAIWASMVNNHLPERTTALSAPQSGPPKQLATPMDHLLGVQALRIVSLRRSRVRRSGQRTEEVLFDWMSMQNFSAVPRPRTVLRAVQVFSKCSVSISWQSGRAGLRPQVSCGRDWTPLVSNVRCGGQLWHWVGDETALRRNEWLR